MEGGMNSQSVIPGYAGGTISTDTDTTGGITVDTQGYDTVAFALYAGTRTDGSYLLKIMETDNADGTTGATEVAAYNVQQTLIASNTVKKVEAKPSKRFARLRVTSTAVTSGCVMKGAVAVLSKARNNPVS